MWQENFKLNKNQFGRRTSRVLRVSKNGQLHTVRELIINHLISTDNNDEFTNGDNSEVIETNSHGNMIFILAKNNGIKSPEDFGINFCKHMFNTYKNVMKVEVHLEEVTWDRIKYEGSEKLHNHAFVNNPKCKRFAKVEMERNDFHPKVTSGMENFKLLKSTKSSFIGFVQDEYCDQIPLYDRMLCNNISCSWTYATPKVDFDATFKKIQNLIAMSFAGDLEKGVQSASTQNNSFIAEKLILENVKEVKTVRMILPNMFFNAFNFEKFNSLVVDDEETVFVPIESPNGLVHSEMERI